MLVQRWKTMYAGLVEILCQISLFRPNRSMAVHILDMQTAVGPMRGFWLCREGRTCKPGMLLGCCVALLDFRPKCKFKAGSAEIWVAASGWFWGRGEASPTFVAASFAATSLALLMPSAMTCRISLDTASTSEGVPVLQRQGYYENKGLMNFAARQTTQVRRMIAEAWWTKLAASQNNRPHFSIPKMSISVD